MNGPQQRLDAWAGRSAPSRLGACETPVACEQPASAPARAAPQVNKMDDPSITGPDGAWSQERYNEICTGLTPFLKACGYNPKKDIVFLPMSGLLGHNLRDAVPPGVCPWYKARRGLLPAAPSFARGPPLPAALHDQRWQGSLRRPACLPCPSRVADGGGGRGRSHADAGGHRVACASMQEHALHV